jgi:DNA-binding transcriptional ArsR family regulator
MSKTTTTTTSEAVLAALAAGPADAGEVARRAGIGRSTAGKALAVLAGSGAVERTPGGRDGARRLADRWSLPGVPTEEQPTENGTSPERASSGRLPKGELRALVLAYLRGHPGEHSPTAVAKALEGRSGGAVSNALAKLAASGEAAQTSAAPRRYQAVP